MAETAFLTLGETNTFHESSSGGFRGDVFGKSGGGTTFMSIFSTAALAFSMSADSFAAAVGKGVSMPRPKIGDAARIGLIFAAVETVTPIIGWLAGLTAKDVIAAYDHWIAFIILSLVGGKLIVESLEKDRAEEKTNHKPGILILTAIGTSIDAMAVGVTFALLDIGIWVSALAIGAATFLMATLGIMTGHCIGTRGGRIAEALGGAVLILIGTKILLDHLGLLA